MCGGSANIGGARPGSGRCAITVVGFHSIAAIRCIEYCIVIAVDYPSITTGTLNNTAYNANNCNTTLQRYDS